MVADPAAHSLEAEPAQLDPQLQRAHAPSELGRVIRVVADRRHAVERPQVLRMEAERRGEPVHPAREQQRCVERREQPLVRIDDDRVGALPALERCPQLGHQGDRARVGGIHVEPRPLAFGNVGHGSDWVDRCRRRRPDRRDDRDRQAARRPIGLDRRLERLGAELEPLVDRDPHQRRTAEPERHARLLDRAVGLGRGVDPEGRHVPPCRKALGRGIDSGCLTCRGKRDERRRRGGIRQQAIEPLRETEAWRSQSTTTPSSSVPIGDVRHSIGFWLSAAVSISPRIPAPDAVEAK